MAHEQQPGVDLRRHATDASPPPPPSPAAPADPRLPPSPLEPTVDTAGGGVRSPVLSIRVGRYLITREIALGGMAAVYEAMQDQPRRTVALKLLRVGWNSAGQQRRFEFESQLLARLRHPHIAQVYDAGWHEHGESRVPYFVMEFIPSARPITRYADENRLTPAKRIELFTHVCDAVHYAHTKGIIHRDLKPGNILVDLQGHPKVIDFGVARAADSDQVSPTLQTGAEQLLGTLPYMSPEQCDIDPRQLDARSDVYSLGVVLYELLCGRLPYDVTKVNLADATRIIREHPPMPPSRCTPGVTGDCETVLLKALHKDRERRYQTADALARDLRHVLADEPIEARRDSVVYLTRGAARRMFVRHRVTAHVVAALIALLSAWTAVDLVNRLVPLNANYRRLLSTRVPPSGAAAVDRFSTVRVVVLREGTDVKRLAQTHGVPEADPARVPTLRAMHGRALMKKLAESGARVVAVDIAMEDPFPPGDGEFVEGVAALRERGIPVIVATKTWRLGADGQPRISPDIAAAVSGSGSTRMNYGAGSPWALQLAAGPRGGAARPGLALAAAAAYWRPFAKASYALDAGVGVGQVAYGPPPPGAAPTELPPSIAAPRVALPAPLFATSAAANPQFDWVPITRCVGFEDPDFDRAGGLGPDDIAGQYFLQMSPQAVLDNSTIGYDEVLDADPRRLREMFADRVVLVGDLCTTGRDAVYPSPDGRRLPAIYAQAMGLEALLTGGAIRQPTLIPLAGARLYGQHLMDITAAVTGIVVALSLWRRLGWRWVVLVVLVVIMSAACVMVYRAQRTMYQPFVATLALVVAAELGSAVERARAGARRLSPVPVRRSVA